MSTPTQPEWVTDLAEIVTRAGFDAEVRAVADYPHLGHSQRYLSIPTGPTATALEIEQGRTSYPSEVVHSVHLTMRTWDRTHGLASETEVGEFSPEQARYVLPILLAGIAAITEREVAAEHDDERRTCEDDAAWATGGYVR